MREYSLLGFVEQVAAISAEVAMAEHECLERGARIVEKEAKDAVGEYQARSGPFAAWAPLADATKEDRERQGFPADEPELRTGELRDSIEHVVIGREAHIGSNSDVMVWQELGTSKMPARSILGGAAFRKEHEVVREIGETVVASLTGGAMFGQMRIR